MECVYRIKHVYGIKNKTLIMWNCHWHSCQASLTPEASKNVLEVFVIPATGGPQFHPSGVVERTLLFFTYYKGIFLAYLELGGPTVDVLNRNVVRWRRNEQRETYPAGPFRMDNDVSATHRCVCRIDTLETPWEVSWTPGMGYYRFTGVFTKSSHRTVCWCFQEVSSIFSLMRWKNGRPF